MDATGHHVRSADVRRRFERVAADFDDADFVHRATCEGLLERMAPLAVDPRLVLDVGSATGAGSRLLAKRFRRATVLAIDSAAAMLRRSVSGRSRFSRIREVQADALRLPVPDHRADLVFANLSLPWIDDLGGFFGEVSRVLAKGGVFVFSTLGPDSFAAIREAWGPGDGDCHVRRFADMHDVGDALVGSGLTDPVLDVDKLTVTYDDPDALLKDLAMSGSRNCLSGRRRTLTGRHRFDAMLERLGPGPLAVELELVFGHAWGAGPRPPAGEYHVEPAAIGRSRRR